MILYPKIRTQPACESTDCFRKDVKLRFEQGFGGKVFFVYSAKNSAGNKRFYNVEVIEQIREEISRLEA